MPTILDFQIQPLSAESYSLAVYERNSSNPLASETFSHRVDFLTDFSVDRLNASTKDAAERFDELQRLGRELYQKLFPPAVEQVWRDYKQCSEFLVLCLRFAEGAMKLEVLPWETLYDKDNEEFIAAGAKTTLTRLPLDVASPGELPPIPRPLKLFGFFASPLDLQDHERLNAEREQEILLEAINDPVAQGRISADFEDEAKLEILESGLRDGYHILHFTGHGISPRDGGGLLLEDAHGKKLPTSVADVIQAVESGLGVLRLAVISGCQTARTLHTGAFNDLARELLRQRLPAVIAMQFSISDEGGLKFAEVLYREIAKGVELERAVHAARRMLLQDKRFFINNDALAIVLLTADGDCLQTTEAEIALPLAEPAATYLGDRLDPLAHGFYGRRREYRKIRDGLLYQDQRAVIIHGIGGIGKTALLTHAINRLRPRFKNVMSFDCRRAALAPETILLELHRYFATQGMPQLQSLIGQNAPPETLANEIAHFLMQLTEWPLLIVFDNFESQLDERREIANADLRIFLTTLVRATVTGSRFLFTTRYLFDLDGERLGNLQELPLGDLSRAEALMLMQKLPNLAQVAYRDKLAVLEKFGGHPYALVTLDRHCNHQPLDQALRDASSLESELREFLAIELNYRRLSERARELLNRLAAFRITVPFEAAEWVMGEDLPVSVEALANIKNKLPNEMKTMNDKELLSRLSVRQPGSDINVAVREVIDWGFLRPEVNDAELRSLSVHSSVRDFCRDQQSHEMWRERLRDAAKFFTTRTVLIQPDDKSPADVWDEIEASELLMEAKDFEEATYIMTNTTLLLDRWGHGRFVEEKYRQLFSKVGGRALARILLNHAVILQARGEYQPALRQYRHALMMLEKLEDRAGVATSLHNIGCLHYLCGDYESALKQNHRSLAMFEKLKDRTGVARSLGQIGTIHKALGQYKLALEKYQRSLTMFEMLSDQVNVANLLGQIGMVHQHRGEYESALKHYQRSLTLQKKFGNHVGVAKMLHAIGSVLDDRGEYKLALEQYRQSLTMLENLGDRAGVANSLNNIGLIHMACGEYEAALDLYQRSLAISEELGHRTLVAAMLQNIGIIHYLRDEYELALELCQRSLAISEELGNQVGVADSFSQIGRLFTETERYTEAFPMLLNARAIFIELQSPKAKITADMLKDLRTSWGAANFDAAWREATNENVPEWLTDEPDATKS